MSIPSVLLTGAAILIPVSPAFAQQQGAPPPVGPVEPATVPTSTEPVASGAAASAQPVEDTGDEEEIVVTGQRARGSVVGDIPPENTLNARDVRATGATNITELLDALAPQI